MCAMRAVEGSANQVETFLKRQRIFWLLVITILGLALLVRMYDISARPFHGDEGVNFHFIKQTMSKGYYPYSHENYHGPSHFYLTLAFTSVFGFSDLSMRASAIMMGWLCVLATLFLLRTESRLFTVLSMLFVGFSASLVFISRYAIHESLFIFSGLMLAWGVYFWFQTRNKNWHYLSGLALGLLIATKETFIITLFCIFLAFLALGDWRSVWQDLRRQWPTVFNGLLIAVIVVLLLYSGGLRWAGGLRELFYSVPQWIGRNESDVGHFKHFSYYLFVFFGSYVADFLKLQFNYDFKPWPSEYATEPQLWVLVVAIPALIIASLLRPRWIMQRQFALLRFLLIWTFSTWLVYSMVSYKTPWLIVNISLPAALLLAWLVSKVFSEQDVRFWIGSLATIILLYLTWDGTFKNNFLIPYGQGNALSYVHPHQGMLRFLGDLEDYKKKFGHTRLLIGTDHYWPLPYYLRDHKEGVAYAHSKDPDQDSQRYDVMLIDHTIKWSNPDWQSRYYRITDAQEAYAYFRIKRDYQKPPD